MESFGFHCKGGVFLALDGIFLHFIRREIEQIALNARIDKIHQPTREEIVLSLRWRGGGGKLLLGAGANSPRVHFTKEHYENPAQPPMFCMLLRKHLGSGRLAAVRQLGLERILYLDFETVNEMGDEVTITLAVEIMGRYSNIIAIGPEGKIIDAIKRVDDQMSGVRLVLPGMRYVLPPPQYKLSLLEAGPEEALAKIMDSPQPVLQKAVMQALQGVSPLVCREIAHFAARSADCQKQELSEYARDKLRYSINSLSEMVRSGEGRPCIVKGADGKPVEFSFMEIHQYGLSYTLHTAGSYSELLDSFYLERERITRMRQRGHDLLKLLVNISDRISRKLALQRQELADCADRESLKIRGDLLSSYLHELHKGMKRAELHNYYSENGETILIELDEELTPVQNAQKYYTEYRKAATAEKMLTQLIRQGEEELSYIDSVFEALTRVTTEAELAEIRTELREQGYLKGGRKNGKPDKATKPQKYLSSDGFVIYCGKNNKQNDRLTLRDSKKQDIWLHAHNIPGSHTVVATEGREVPNTTLEQAAVICAYNSKARDAGQVPVDFTEIRNVKKPQGAKCGMVIYDRYQTVFVKPDAELVKSLLAEKE